MIEIWCDGACVPNPGIMGIGIVFRYKGKQKEINGNLFNERADYLAGKDLPKWYKI